MYVVEKFYQFHFRFKMTADDSVGHDVLTHVVPLL